MKIRVGVNNNESTLIKSDSLTNDFQNETRKTMFRSCRSE